ncbi:MAG: DNA-processing protein DprA [Lachnospiraceae bacterium]|nr:DNA-processing protein DprA [Lachnospiraceae bacterium]
MKEITNEDIYAYIYKNKGLALNSAKILCKLFGGFENLAHTDFKDLYTDSLINGIKDDDAVNCAKLNLIKIKNITESIQKEENFLKEEAVLFYEKLNEKGIKWTHVNSKDYPERLLQIHDSPLILYYKGELIREDIPSVAIIGARNCSVYGEKTAVMFGKELAMAGVQIISGMARGVDGIAQRSAINANGSTFGILGCGIDIVYPRDNDDIFKSITKSGGLISEYPPGVQPLRQFFPQRNRIISGLSDIVLVVEARRKSGTYITVTQALEQGREVFAVPGRITDSLSEGCNRLIGSGSGVADCAESVLECLRLKYKFDNFSEIKRNKNNTDNLSDLRKKIMETIKDDGKTLSLIADSLSTNISVEELTSELVEMETDGILVKIGNMYYNKL